MKFRFRTRFLVSLLSVINKFQETALDPFHLLKLDIEHAYESRMQSSAPNAEPGRVRHSSSQADTA
jgi:hypothetical protein